MICEYCGKDFQSLGCHIWHCKARITSVTVSPQDATALGTPDPYLQPTRTSPQPSRTLPPDDHSNAKNSTDQICHCGRVCKGLRGLKAHQRSCKLTMELFDITKDLTVRVSLGERVDPDQAQQVHCTILDGVKLPTSPDDWTPANTARPEKLTPKSQHLQFRFGHAQKRT